MAEAEKPKTPDAAQQPAPDAASATPAPAPTEEAPLTPKEKAAAKVKAFLAKAKLGRKFPGKRPDGELISEWFESLTSEESDRRFMGWIFTFSILGLIGLAVIGAHRFQEVLERYKKDKMTETEISLQAYLLKQAELAKKKFSSLPIGTYIVQLKPIPNVTPSAGTVEMAEIDMTVECDTPETCNFIEANLVRVRNELTSALVSVDREDLLSTDGKRKIQRELVERLNSWLPKGRVERIYFSKLLLG